MHNTHQPALPVRRAARPVLPRFFRAAGMHHNDVFAAPGLIEAIAAFAREATGG